MKSSQELIQHIKACGLNNRESQKVIYSSFYGYAMSVCCRYTNRHEDAIEILNDGFLKVFKGLKQFKPSYTDVISSFKGWLGKIMIFTAIDHNRKFYKETNVINLESSVIEMPVNNENALDKMSYDEIIQAVQNLSPAYRTVFNLYVIEGFTHEEIAEALDISAGTSKSNLSKAKRNLQKILFRTYKEDRVRNAI